MTSIAIGADEAGAPLKDHLAQYMRDAGYEIKDYGNGTDQDILARSQDTSMRMLQLQEAISEENRQYTTLSNVLHARHEMAKNAIISGGMLPKLGACREALLNGVKRVRILPAEAAGSLPDLCSSRVAHGTEVMVA